MLLGVRPDPAVHRRTGRGRALDRTSRSKLELFLDFGVFAYPNEVGPGVYDIHSPRVPSVAEVEELLAQAADALPLRQVWVNPDCGLKTRGYDETVQSLRNLVAATSAVRAAVDA